MKSDEESNECLKCRFLIEDVTDGEEENSANKDIGLSKKISRCSNRKNSVTKKKFDHKIISDQIMEFKCEIYQKNVKNKFSWKDFNDLWIKFISRKHLEHNFFDFHYLESIIHKENYDKFSFPDYSSNIPNPKNDIIKEKIIESNENCEINPNNNKDFKKSNSQITSQTELDSKLFRNMLMNVNTFSSNSVIFNKNKLTEEFNFLIDKNLSYHSYKFKNKKINDVKNIMNNTSVKNTSTLCRKKYSEDIKKYSLFDPIFTNVKQHFLDKNINTINSKLNNSLQIRRQSFDLERYQHISSGSILSNFYNSDNSGRTALTSPRLLKIPSKKREHNNPKTLKITNEVNLEIHKSKKRKFDQLSFTLDSYSIESTIKNNICSRCQNVFISN